MNTAHKMFALFLATLLLFVGVNMALASTLQGLKVTLQDTRPSQESYQTFQFTTSTGAALKCVEFNYCEEASGGCTAPDGLSTLGVSLTAATNMTEASWTESAIDGNSGIRIANGDGETISTGTVVTLTFDSITNSQMTANCDDDADTSSDTCYVQIQSSTAADCSTGIVDTGVATYTVIQQITVTATVDPTFTFVVAAVNEDAVHGDITLTETSTASTLPFGNLTTTSPNYVGHDLQVITNTQGGYTVKMKMLLPSAGAGVMQGVYSENNIDPFGANVSFTWGSPQPWTQPDGSAPSISTGWLGANTTDTDVAGWSSPELLFGPVQTTLNTVMQSSRVDSGANHVYVTYALGVNVYQPSDVYTGTLVYSAVPTY